MTGYTHTHPLLRPIIAADNQEWRALMQKEREETRGATHSALNNHQTISDAVLKCEEKGGVILRQPYRGDVLVSEFDDFRAFVNKGEQIDSEAKGEK